MGICLYPIRGFLRTQHTPLGVLGGVRQLSFPAVWHESPRAGAGGRRARADAVAERCQTSGRREATLVAKSM